MRWRCIIDLHKVTDDKKHCAPKEKTYNYEKLPIGGQPSDVRFCDKLDTKYKDFCPCESGYIDANGFCGAEQPYPHGRDPMKKYIFKFDYISTKDLQMDPEKEEIGLGGRKG